MNPTPSSPVYSLHQLSYSISHCLILVILYAEELVLELINCQLLCEQQTCELTGANNSSRLKVMYAGVSSDVMQVRRAFSAAASCGCCDGFKRLLTAGSGERTVYSTSES